MTQKLTHVLVLVSTHEDGTTKGQMLHRGTFEDCDRVADLLPAVAVSDETVKSVEKWIGTVEQWERATGEVWRPS